MKLRGTKDLSVATVGKYGTLQEFSFFDKVSIWPVLPFCGLAYNHLCGYYLAGFVSSLCVST